MPCRNPYITEYGFAAGCGKCDGCRLKKKRMWTHRIMLEALCHTESTFITLTYSEKDLPLLSQEKGSLSTLSPIHLTNWLKRLRSALEPRKIRYFAVGEYGTIRWRPHYHILVFGLPGCSRGQTLQHFADKKPVPLDCCDSCRLLQKTWEFGVVHQGTVTSASAAYVAGYSVKNMTSPNDTRLRGRYPEFMRSSRRPGIGVPGLWDAASSLLEHGLEEGKDVPTGLRHGSSVFPLGRVLRDKLRQMVGRPTGAPQEVLDEMAEEMFDLRVMARSSEENPSLSKLVAARDVGLYEQMVARGLVWKKRESQ